jgi:hypothetical protein
VRKEDVVSRNPKVMNGALVFKGTRVPVEVLPGFLRLHHDGLAGVSGLLTVAAPCKRGYVDIRVGWQVLLDGGFVLRPAIA